jgi:RNA polymerase sigma factor (TIGR02999 family)
VAEARCRSRPRVAGSLTRLPRSPIHTHTRGNGPQTGSLRKEPGVDLASVVMSSTHDVTALLAAWGEGDRAAQSELMEIVYAELKGLAKAYLRREYANQSLAATALVHEAYLKLVNQRHVHWHNRSHFFGIAAQAMRRILVDHARATLAAKRGGADTKRVPAAELHAIQEPPDVNVLALDAALSRLETVEPRWSRLVELRFFVGLSVEETAAAVGLSPATVKRDWSLARAWLYREIGASGNTAGSDSDCASQHLAPVPQVKTDGVD